MQLFLFCVISCLDISFALPVRNRRATAANTGGDSSRRQRTQAAHPLHRLRPYPFRIARPNACAPTFTPKLNRLPAPASSLSTARPNARRQKLQLNLFPQLKRTIPPQLQSILIFLPNHHQSTYKYHSDQIFPLLRQYHDRNCHYHAAILL